MAPPEGGARSGPPVALVTGAAGGIGRAVADGWDEERTGFVYTTAGGAAVVADRFHWVLTEAIGAAAYLYRATGDRSYDR